MINHNKYMKMCLNLAKRAEGKTSPNPMVGAILVDEKGRILSKGWHKGYGKDHAEIDCIKNYEKKFLKPDYKNLTLYVNLEPCNHFGKTPPCSDFIISKGIKNVVIGVLDPNKNHSGGAKKLEKSGIKVVEGILKEDAEKLNEIFFKNVKENCPFVAIKTATTLDGKIATKTGSSKWITSAKSRLYVQKLRNKYDAVITSSSTVIKDNPSLTTRLSGGKSPVRIIFDSNLKTNPTSKVFNDDGVKVILFCVKGSVSKNKYPKNVKLEEVVPDKNGKIDLKEALKVLYNEYQIKSVLIEAGGILCGQFLKENLVDKIYHFVAPKIIGDNSAKSFISGFNIADINECYNFEIVNLKKLSPDFMLEICPKNL